MWINDTSNITSEVLSALVCSGANLADIGLNDSCVAICPNPDLSGIGVRTAFYIQSVINGKRTLPD